jgi:hypothetical protein
VHACGIDKNEKRDRQGWACRSGGWKGMWEMEAGRQSGDKGSTGMKSWEKGTTGRQSGEKGST